MLGIPGATSKQSSESLPHDASLCGIEPKSLFACPCVNAELTQYREKDNDLRVTGRKEVCIRGVFQVAGLSGLFGTLQPPLKPAIFLPNYHHVFGRFLL